MSQVREMSPYAGQIVKVKQGIQDPVNRINFSGRDFIVEDWWENVYGKSWMFSDGNPAALMYAFRAGVTHLPTDNEVLYGKVGGYGHLFHITELELPEVV